MKSTHGRAREQTVDISRRARMSSAPSARARSDDVARGVGSKSARVSVVLRCRCVDVTSACVMMGMRGRDAFETRGTRARAGGGRWNA